jgi:hypothetical protein
MGKSPGRSPRRGSNDYRCHCPDRGYRGSGRSCCAGTRAKPRPATAQHLMAAVNAQGKIVGLQHRVVAEQIFARILPRAFRASGNKDAPVMEFADGIRDIAGHQVHLCHVGPMFSNGEFADIGVPFFVRPGVGDTGRHGGIRALQANPYNLLSSWSDGPDVATLNLDRLQADGDAILQSLRLTYAETRDLLAFLHSLTAPDARRWKPGPLPGCWPPRVVGDLDTRCVGTPLPTSRIRPILGPSDGVRKSCSLRARASPSPPCGRRLGRIGTRRQSDDHQAAQREFQPGAPTLGKGWRG